MSTLIFFILYLFCFCVADGSYLDFLQLHRIYRHCHKNIDGKPVAAVSPLEEESKFTLSLTFLSGLIFLLIALGLIKGLIGLFCFPKFGVYGLNLLIDLPRPLNSYQEANLRHRQVVYDVGGWPVHPDTQKRTVRVLTKRTEFCLNLIFFLACPMAACVFICSLCCCIRNCNSQSCDDTSFKNVNVVRLTSLTGLQKTTYDANSPPKNVYKQDGKEEADTRYVLDAMKKSKESINEIRNK